MRIVIAEDQVLLRDGLVRLLPARATPSWARSATVVVWSPRSASNDRTW